MWPLFRALAANQPFAGSYDWRETWPSRNTRRRLGGSRAPPTDTLVSAFRRSLAPLPDRKWGFLFPGSAPLQHRPPSALSENQAAAPPSSLHDSSSRAVAGSERPPSPEKKPHSSSFVCASPSSFSSSPPSADMIALVWILLSPVLSYHPLSRRILPCLAVFFQYTAFAVAFGNESPRVLHPRRLTRLAAPLRRAPSLWATHTWLDSPLFWDAPCLLWLAAFACQQAEWKRGDKHLRSVSRRRAEKSPAAVITGGERR